MTIPPSVCVGLEVEFLVAISTIEVPPREDRWKCLASKRDIDGLAIGDFSPMEATCIHKVCQVMASGGAPVGCKGMPLLGPITPGQFFGSSLVQLTETRENIRVWNKEAAASTSGTVAPSNYWFVVPERHLTQDCVSKSSKTPSVKYAWFGTEINSPILTQPQEFHHGLPTLRTCLEGIQDKMVVGLNSGCGLHLHVNDAGNMKLQTALRVVTLVWHLEDTLLYPVCHPHRSKSAFSMRVSVESSIAMEKGEPAVSGEGATVVALLTELMGKFKGRKKVDKRLVGAMKRLWSQPDLTSLGIALRKFNEGPVHTTTRCALVVSKYNTLEFRYPESTFDANFISCWTDLVRHLYGIAMKSQVDFNRVLSRVYDLATRDQVPRWDDMMAAIQFQTNINRWQMRLNQYTSNLKDLDNQGILPAFGR
ncbi:uncharacterized protein NECHADRAFT_34537 [Fusarium vanettenii 77-13-4]|uniref:Amidoligase enzyme n=1 Tax=Fusarium vanettenii (strain ATCC MYA-4622 / CBS 123669 / FGSC 9596 / NRRL 45880 / 77-13-4) TaxID=660122 RepID=C7ZC78_FUSV7|nr:uncharacterized protein NECHADRAFT_34537 [Fusarium vanettenii 77-13-4]EEU38213.1 hypothetical protein NECHADRAFT_34537 [Fusarium vanettenii 77-13-4]